jgi:hypothetical protein
VRPPQVIESPIGATILVNHRGFVGKSENAGHWLPVLGSEANLHFVADACDQVAKPPERWRRQELPAASQHHQVVELFEQRFRPTLFVNQALACCAPDLPPNAIMMEPPVKVLKAGLQIELMPAVALGFGQIRKNSEV